VLQTYAERFAVVNTLAGDEFNRGIRAYYFGFAALAWFAHPALFMALTVTICWCSTGATSTRRRCAHSTRRARGVRSEPGRGVPLCDDPPRRAVSAGREPLGGGGTTRRDR